jgi:lipopolysaccharide/colanic/teichoic acid biosynthesis glycosyltransferase
VSVASGAVINYRVLFADDGLDRDSPSGPDAVDDDAAAPEIEAQNPALVRPFYSRVKIVIDSVIAAVSLLLLSPLFAVIAALIKIDSRGSVFFADLREGCDGTLFRCWKFRTMRQDASLRQRDLIERNDVDGPQFKLEKDPRLTRIGRWLRPMSLDELPQLFNVLLGTMSLIGPRPSPFRENQRCVPWRDARLSVRPGITGLWQVCRHDRPGGDFHQWIYFDLLYVQHMSFSLDLKILLATILTGGGQRNVSVHWLIPAPRLRA